MASESGSISHPVDSQPSSQPSSQPPSHPPYESVHTDSSTPPSVYGARDGRIHSGGIVRQMRLRNRSNLALLSANPDSTCALWKCSAASICPDLALVDGLWASDMAAELSARRV